METKNTKDKKDILISKYKLDNPRIFNIILILIFVGIIFFITIRTFEGYKLRVEIGDVVQDDIRATKEIYDKNETLKLREQAINNVEPRYRIYPSVQMEIKDIISSFLDATRDVKSQTNISLTKRAELLNKEINLELTNKDLYTALKMEFKELNSFENTLTDLINQLMGSGIKEEELNYEKENLILVFESLNIPDDQKSLGLSLLSQTMEPNEFIDIAATERKQKEESNKVADVIIKENEIIASKGEIINKEKLDLIKESGLLKDGENSDLSMYTGITLLILVSILFILGYIYLFNRTILNNNRMLILILVVLLTIVISQGLYRISPYIMPISTGALLIAILVDPNLGLIVNLFLSFLLGFLFRLDISIIFMFIIGGSFGVLTVMKQQQRYNILFNGFIVGIVNLMIITSFSLIKENIGVDFIIKSSHGLLNGIISGIITLGSLPIWENIFSVLTPIKLLELSNPNHPLLRNLLLDAPGTYHHSLLVGNLSEAAAEEIGANPLLARVGSYYHDIGKVKKPFYFKENQFGMENPHNRLNPKESTQIITNHTIDGINMAKEKRLPKEIIDIIEQHHGTTSVAYFYHKMKEENKDLDINIDSFRYKGIKPQSKEAALVMLADSTEAAVRSIKGPDREKIETMVSNVVKGKLNDGQLDECDITYKDITKIINTFVNIIISIYHDRIEYPETKTALEENN